MSPGRGGGHTGMTSASFVDLAPAADRVTRLLDAVTDDRLEEPTPCADTTVGALLSHLLGLAEAFRAAAAKEPDRGTPPAVQPPSTRSGARSCRGGSTCSSRRGATPRLGKA